MTPTQEILIRLAREAMEDLRGYRKGIDVALAAIDEALAEQPANVAAVNTSSERVDKQAQNVHMQPHRKPWVGLTEEEVDECYYWKGRQWTTDELVRHVEAKLREKNA